MVVSGSHLYGTATEISDIDKRGVCVPPRNVVMGFANRFEQKNYTGEDTTVYSLMRFIELASDCNPNIIELLFAPKEAAVVWTDLWEELVKHRQKFVSANAYHRFSGYAFAQLKKIKSHKGWLLNPPSHKPSREEFGLTDSSLGLRELSTGVDAYVVDPQVVKVIQQEKNYKAALTRWNQYEEWKKNRNAKRAELEAKHGFDSKHGSHLVRLLRMGKEILTTGKVHVKRPDATELLAIKNGKWTFEQLMEYVEPLMKELDDIYENKKYVIPYSVNKQELSDLAVELHEKYWRWTGEWNL